MAFSCKSTKLSQYLVDLRVLSPLHELDLGVSCFGCGKVAGESPPFLLFPGAFV